MLFFCVEAERRLITLLSGKQHRLAKWSLAFEVNIKQVTHSDTELLGVTKKWLSAYEESQPFKKHGNHTDRVLKHIVLDFAGTCCSYVVMNSSLITSS